MAQITIRMVTDAITAFVQKDVSLANEVINRDDIVDELFIKIKKYLITIVREDGSRGEAAFALLQIAKYYERIGDHAVNTAEWALFSLTGKHKERQVL
jgi:phosphate transport system protein